MCIEDQSFELKSQLLILITKSTDSLGNIKYKLIQFVLRTYAMVFVKAHFRIISNEIYNELSPKQFPTIIQHTKITNQY